MSMRVYLQPQKVVKHPEFLRPEGYPKDADPKPNQWGLYFLNGLMLRWDNEVGLPYVEVSYFATWIPDAVYALLPYSDEKERFEWEHSPVHHVSIVDSWTGEQRACLMHGLEEYWRKKMGFDSPNFKAMLTRQGNTVHLELALMPCAPQLARDLYWIIRNSNKEEWKTTFENIFPLDRMDNP